MISAVHHPWFREAVEGLDLRRRDRVLMVTASLPAYVRVLAKLVGTEGSVLVVEPDRTRAQKVADLDFSQVEVLALDPTGKERFGEFDTMFACPLAMPTWPLSQWAEAALHNLRPGGRFVIDLPAERMSEDLAIAWQESGGDPDALQPMQGVSERQLAASLRANGLRQVEAAVGTHLLHVESSTELAEIGRRLLHADRDKGEEMAILLTRRLKTAGPIDVIFRRTRVHGIR